MTVLPEKLVRFVERESIMAMNSSVPSPVLTYS
jgi:hypothetical protein